MFWGKHAKIFEATQTETMQGLNNPEASHTKPYPVSAKMLEEIPVFQLIASNSLIKTPKPHKAKKNTQVISATDRFKPPQKV